MHDPIAVVGIACRLPGAEGADHLWRLLGRETDAISGLPSHRWPSSAIYDSTPATPGRLYAPCGGFVADGDEYDRELFGISAHEAEHMDPQQGMALELAWHALEDAAIAPSAHRGRDVGVYMGVSTRDYDRRACVDWKTVDVRTALGACGSVIANRVSYTLGICGPSITVDVGCSSSLVSIHLACQALRLNECELALAGGVQLILSPANIIAFSQGRLLACDGRSKSFSQRADGYVCGEGGGCVVLKKLDAALRDEDFIYAVIVGTAVNHNGMSNGLSAPLGAAQRKVITAALAAAGVKPADIGYVEAHSSGTRLGDVIEVNALKNVLGAGRDTKNVCYLGSAKPTFGHLEAAAGVASFLKAALAVHHGIIPKSLHAQPVNPDLKLTDTAFRIATETVPWPQQGAPRRAGISAFSFGGANAHVVIEQAPERVSTLTRSHSEASPRCVLPLSAQSSRALRELAARFGDHLAIPQSALRFEDICYTAGVGRSHLPCRLAVVARSAPEAHAALSAFLEGNDSKRLWSSESVSGRRPAQEADVATKAAASYVRGATVDWGALYTGARRCSIPLYPMQRHRHWKLTDSMDEPAKGRVC